MTKGHDKMTDDDYGMTQAEFARRLGLHESTVREAIRRGEIRAGRFGRLVLVPISELRRILGGCGTEMAAV